jgi:hypothetical protein
MDKVLQGIEYIEKEISGEKLDIVYPNLLTRDEIIDLQFAVVKSILLLN